MVAAAAAGGALAVGGVVAKRVLSQGGRGDGDELEATAPDNVEPIAKAKPVPKPKAAKPEAAKPAKASKPKPKAKPKPPKAKKPKPEKEPGNRSHDKGPHQALNNPVGEPDETEYPDPYETRPDSRDPDSPFGEPPHPATGAESTSEPPLEDDPANPDGGRPPRREKLDD